MLGCVRRLGLGSGMLLAVPIPAAAAAEGEVVEAATRAALAEAEARGVKGNEVRAGMGGCGGWVGVVAWCGVVVA